MKNEKETIIVAFATQKGGSGKSTITHMIGTAIGDLEEGKTVLVIDLDEQKSLTKVYKRLSKEGFNFYDFISASLTEGVYDVIKENYGKYDYILLDTPGTFMADGIKETFLLCHFVFIPIQPSQLDIDSAVDTIRLLNEIKALKESKNGFFEYYTFISKAEPGTLWTRQLQDYLEVIKVKTLESTMPVYNAYKNLTQTGDNILSKNKKWGKEAYAFDKLYSEILTIINS